MLSVLLHASCVSFNGQGVLLTGAPGIGKSELALLLIDKGAALVSDDQTELRVQDGLLVASPPASIAGLIEVRHVGLLRAPYAPSVPVALYVELVDRGGGLERLPEIEKIFLLDQPVRKLRLYAHEASLAAKIGAVLLYSPVE